MVTALVMINTERGQVGTTAQAVLAVEGVREVYSVSGVYDLVAIVQNAEYERLADVITGQIANIATITQTHTLMAFQCYSNSDMERMWAIGSEER